MKTLLLSLGLLLTVFSFRAKTQTFMVKGTVKDASDIVIPGVTIVIKGTTRGTVTDIDGKFRIGPLQDGDVLVFSYVGYLTEEYTVSPDTSSLNIVMTENIEALDEVVVIGYGTMKKSCVTGAIATVRAPIRSISRIKGRSRTRKACAMSVTTPMVSEDDDIDIHAGMLTAGEVNDFSKWNLWTDLSANELNRYQRDWKINPSDRYMVQLRSPDGFPVINAKVDLVT